MPQKINTNFDEDFFVNFASQSDHHLFNECKHCFNQDNQVGYMNNLN